MNTRNDKYLEMIDTSRAITGEPATKIVKFSTKKKAESAARSIGWSLIDVVRIEIMGFYVWTITDPHGNAVTWDGYNAWGGDISLIGY
jgi:hypothetical protein